MTLHISSYKILTAPLALVALLMLCLIFGCRKATDAKLVEIDAMMESNPDFALTFIEDYTLNANSSSSDSAYYALLLTHARYKQFIDETDDSLISVAVDWFEKHKDTEKASRALFLQGMIRLNAQRLGDAAVSFSKGLDIAHEGKHYMWEGQCARGLYRLYGEIHDGSAQVNYATRAYDAFLHLGDEGWIANSRLAMAIAFNNNCQYDKTLSLLSQLEEDGGLSNDSLSLSHLFSLRGLALFALGSYSECLDSYRHAYEMNPNVLSEADIQNIGIAESELQKSGENSQFNSFAIEETSSEGNPQTESFVLYARQGRYKEAYESLEVYKTMQDSVLSVIFRNNVSDSVIQYKSLQSALLKEQTVKERLTYWVVMLIILISGIICAWRVREKMHKDKDARRKTEEDMAIIISDLRNQIESAEKSQGPPVIRSKSQAADDFIKTIHQQYADANRVCDEYYQGECKNKNGDGILEEELRKIINSLTETEGLKSVIEYVDEKSDGLYRRFEKDFYDLSGEAHRLFLYLMMGMSSRSISVIIGHKLSSVYNKKSRLKAKIEQSDVACKNEYLKFF